MKLAALLLATLPLFGAAGDPTAARIVGPTTTVADALSASNTADACNGWCLEIDVSSLGSGGTYALGIGSNNTPAAANIVLAVTSSGYNTSAVLGSIVRPVWATHQLRQIFNAGSCSNAIVPCPNDETVVGSTITLRFALSEYIYATDTVTITIAGGIYTKSGVPTNSFSGAVTNNSTVPYSLSRVIASWSWPGWTRINSSLDGDGNNHADGSFTVRAVGYHSSARNGQPLAAMKFTLTGVTSAHVETVTVSGMTVDSGINDLIPSPEYIATFSTAQINNFTQGELLKADFAGVPWVGGAGSVMDTSDGVNTMPTPNYAPQFFLCDRTGAFGTPVAVVDGSVGNDSTCVAVQFSAFNGVSDGATLAPCLTIKGAGIKIRALNVSTNAAVHSDVNGRVYVQAGTYTYAGSTTAISASTGTQADATWVTVMPFPNVARASVIINATTASPNNRFTATTKTKFYNVTIAFESGTNTISSGVYIWFDNCSLLATSGTSLLTGTSGGVAYYTRNTVGTNGTCNGGVSDCLIGGFTVSSGAVYPALIRSTTLTGVKHVIFFFTAIGNFFGSAVTNTSFAMQTSDTQTVKAVHAILAYNKLLNQANAGGSPVAFFAGQSGILGGAAVQNVGEITSSNAATNWNFGGGGTFTPIDNVLQIHNTWTGERRFHSYNDQNTTILFRRGWAVLGQLEESTAIKSDTFTGAGGASANRIGNWAQLYGVGDRANMDVAAKNVGTGDPVGFSFTFAPEFPGIYSDYPTIAASRDLQAATQTPSVTSTARLLTYPKFTNRLAFDGDTTGTGLGDYSLQIGSPASGMVPAGYAALPVDITGAVRRNDGTGAAGAFESPASSTIRKRVIQ